MSDNDDIFDKLRKLLLTVISSVTLTAMVKQIEGRLERSFEKHETLLALTRKHGAPIYVKVNGGKVVTELELLEALQDTRCDYPLTLAKLGKRVKPRDASHKRFSDN